MRTIYFTLIAGLSRSNAKSKAGLTSLWFIGKEVGVVD